MANEIDIRHRQKLLELLKKRRQLLSMPAEKALDEILDHPDSLPLVHSFAEEDLYFLIHDIGLDDALPILGMASESQWEYILDVEVWEKDRIGVQPALRWMDMLLKADRDRLIQWVQGEKRMLLEFCLFQSIEVRVREHDEDPTGFGDDFFTLDGTYYIRFRPHPFAVDKSKEHRSEREEIVFSLLKKLADADHIVFQNILFEFSSMIPTETEEEVYRLRNVRMAEKGFLPFEEAIGIYQPLPEGVQNRIKNSGREMRDTQESPIPLSLYPVSVLTGEDLFSQAMRGLDSDSLFASLESEFAVLCNTIVSADQRTIRERSELSEVVAKACGYISIGLQHLSGSHAKPEMEALLSFLADVPLQHIFKLGYGLVLELKWRADRWQKDSWFRQHKHPLGFWGEKRMGILGGLLLKRPLFYDNYQTGRLYREFRSLNDIRIAEEFLSETICYDTLFSLMPIPAESGSSHYVTYKNMLLTLWAKNQLGLDETLLPIKLDRFRPFFQSLFQTPSPLPGDGDKSRAEIHSRRIATHVKNTFVEWISQKTGLTRNEVTSKYGLIFKELFQEIEQEYGRVPVKDLDPRYVHLFLLQK